MARFIHLSQIKGDRYDEETGRYCETVIPSVINVETIRCFYPRHDGRVGTRITFADGGGFAVRETLDKVMVLAGVEVPAGLNEALAALAAPATAHEEEVGENEDEMD